MKRTVEYVAVDSPPTDWDERVLLLETPQDGMYWLPDGNIYWTDPTGIFRLEVRVHDES